MGYFFFFFLVLLTHYTTTPRFDWGWWWYFFGCLWKIPTRPKSLPTIHLRYSHLTCPVAALSHFHPPLLVTCCPVIRANPTKSCPPTPTHPDSWTNLKSFRCAITSVSISWACPELTDIYLEKPKSLQRLKAICREEFFFKPLQPQWIS